MLKNPSKKTICVFTGGGVAPAVNAILYGAIFEAQKLGWRVLGGKWGWKSMLNGEIINIDTSRLGSKYNDLKNIGGTFLGTSRTNPTKGENPIQKIKETIKKHKIDYLLPIGGDDTLGAANILWNKHKIPLNCVPKTIDNDLNETYFTPGFPTACENLIKFTRAIYNNSKATRKISIIECMGGNAGWLVSCTAAGGADLIIIPEKKTHIKDFLKIVIERYKKNNFLVITIAHQAGFHENINPIYCEKKDEYGIKRPLFISLSLKTEIEKILDCEIKINIPGNFLSADSPNNLDQKTAISLGKTAVKLMAKNKFGYMSCVKRVGNRFTADVVPLSKVCKTKSRKMDSTYFDFDKFYPKKKFFEYLKLIVK